MRDNQDIMQRWISEKIKRDMTEVPQESVDKWALYIYDNFIGDEPGEKFVGRV